MAPTPVPTELIRSVLDSDRAAPGHPRLPDGEREAAARWLTRIFVNHTDYSTHVECLRCLLGRPPAPRIEVVDEQTAGLDKVARVLHLNFPPRRRVDEDQALAVINGGPGAVIDSTLAELLINPGALELLRAMVEDATSGFWGEQFRRSTGE